MSKTYKKQWRILLTRENKYDIIKLKFVYKNKSSDIRIDGNSIIRTKGGVR